MHTSTQPFGIAELVNELQTRIQNDQALLTKVMQFWVTERPAQALNDLEDWTPIDAVEAKSNGKLKNGQTRWIARNREENGTADAFMKIGRRLYVNIPVLIRLLAAQAQGGGHAR